MNLLLTGANGYIGLRLLAALLAQGHHVTAVVRDIRRFPHKDFSSHSPELNLIEGDFSNPAKLPLLPQKIDAAYYFLPTATQATAQEKHAVEGFLLCLARARCNRVIALSSLIPEPPLLSPCQKTTLELEEALRSARCATTIIRTSWIIGAGFSYFELIRDLAERLPILLAPQWMRTRCQPISIRNVIDYLTGLLDHPETGDQTYEAGGPEILTLSEMIRQYAKVRELKRFQVPIPLRLTKLSVRSLALFSSINNTDRKTAIGSLKHHNICKDTRLQQLIQTPLLSFQEATRRALCCVAQNRAPSSWHKLLSNGKLEAANFDQIKVPYHGTMSFYAQVPLSCQRSKAQEALWTVGGENGWQVDQPLPLLQQLAFRLRGASEWRNQLPHSYALRMGDTLNSWTVLLADQDKGRIILYRDHNAQGEAWWEFTFDPLPQRREALSLTCTFRPRGIVGRLYWLTSKPFHKLNANRTVKRFAEQAPSIPACRQRRQESYSVHDVRSPSSSRQW